MVVELHCCLWRCMTRRRGRWDADASPPSPLSQRDGCPKIINLGSAKTDLFYERWGAWVVWVGVWVWLACLQAAWHAFPYRTGWLLLYCSALTCPPTSLLSFALLQKEVFVQEALRWQPAGSGKRPWRPGAGAPAAAAPSCNTSLRPSCSSLLLLLHPPGSLSSRCAPPFAALR